MNCYSKSMKKISFSIIVLIVMVLSCTEKKKKEKPFLSSEPVDQTEELACCKIDSKSRFLIKSDTIKTEENPVGTKGMLFIQGGTFDMGADNNQARLDEYPKHPVRVSSYWIDEHEVTNAQFEKFVDETGYVTVAEKDVDWDEMKKELPPGSPKPEESMLAAGSMVFTPPNYAVPLNDYSQWWTWTIGANWKHPKGPGSSLKGLEDYPVVHICYNDAVAYCKWAGKRLPTEAEWEFSARGGLENSIYPWGNEHIDSGLPKANSWQGTFPNLNTEVDGFFMSSPVKSYSPNGYGLFDMAGNVWEWTSDWYDKDYYKSLPTNEVTVNPLGPEENSTTVQYSGKRKTIRGGSFLCNDSYCSSYRVAARMPGEINSGMSHTGFRCAKDAE